MARLLSVFGLLVAMFGLLSFWLTRAEQRTVLTQAEQALVNPKGEFQMSFVLAGRDYDYSEAAGPLVTRAGEQVRSYVTEAQLGNRTDTIMYVNIVGNHVFMVSIPARHHVKCSAELWVLKATVSGLMRSTIIRNFTALTTAPTRLRKAVSTLLDLPIDYYAVVNIDIFEKPR